jgi:hypothetical protein
MNSVFIILCGFTLFLTEPGNCLAQEKAEGEKTGEPRIEVDNDVYNFGEIYRGSLLNHTFKIKNSGDADLIISDVKKDCGCTVFKLPKDVLAPGEEMEINVKVNTISQEGEIDKKVILYTNDRLDVEKLLSIIGKVLITATIDPPKVRLREVKPGDEIPEQVVRVIPEEGYDLQVTNVISNNPNISARIIGADEEGTKIGVNISSDTDKSFVTGGIRVISNLQEEPFLRIPVKVSIVQPYILSPKSLNFTNIPLDIETPIGYSIVVLNNETEPLNINDVKNKSEYIEYKLTTLEAGIKYRLTVKLLPGFPEESFKDVITLYTNNKMYPEMDIPISVKRTVENEIKQ